MIKVNRLKKKSRLFIVALALVIGGVFPFSASKNTLHADSSTPILSINDVHVQAGNTFDLSGNRVAQQIVNMELGTFIIRFTSESDNQYQSLFSVSNPSVGSENKYFHIYITREGGVGMELRNTDSQFKYMMSRPAALTGIYKGRPVTNTVAFVADAATHTYKLFADGELLTTLSKIPYRFIRDINGASSLSLGGTVRGGKVAYPFAGNIQSLRVYDQALGDDELIAITGQTQYGKKIFYSGDATKAGYFRIPSLLSLGDGTVVASADARYGGTHDAKSNIDIAFSRSEDQGNTWEEPQLPLVFNDYAAQNLNWPRDERGRNIQIQGSAAFIDSVLIEDRSAHKLMLFADAMPAGIGFSNTAQGSGFTMINGKSYLKLHHVGDSSGDFNYSIRENRVIYDDRSGKATPYSLDDNYNLMKNGQYVVQYQYTVHFENGTLAEEKTDQKVPTNIFYRDSPFKVLATNYMVMKTSVDSGRTWSKMHILPPFFGINQRNPLFGPGVGIQMKNGEHPGRLLVSMYNSISGIFGFAYSDDHGENWQFAKTDLGQGGMFAEAQTVEMPDGSLRSFLRTNKGHIGVISSCDAGMTWGNFQFIPQLTAAPYGTQLSVINYTNGIDGKPAIILSAPMATNGRRDGKIWIGLIQDTGNSGAARYDIDWQYSYSVDKATYGYSYSCITELPDGRVGDLFEKYDSWSRGELHLKDTLTFETFSLDELTSHSLSGGLR